MESPIRVGRSALFLITAASLLVVCVDDAMAVPSFARKYRASCSTCHTAYPQPESVCL